VRCSIFRSSFFQISMSTTDWLISGLIFHAVFGVGAFAACGVAAVLIGVLLPCFFFLTVFLADDVLATAFLAADFFAFFNFLTVALEAGLMVLFVLVLFVLFAFFLVLAAIGRAPRIPMI